MIVMNAELVISGVQNCQNMMNHSRLYNWSILMELWRCQDLCLRLGSRVPILHDAVWFWNLDAG